MDCSDKTRRTMSDALRTPKLGDEALAFVSGTPTKPRPGPASGNVPDAPTVAPEVSLPGTQLAPPSNSNGVPKEPHSAGSVLFPGTVSMTFRLAADLSAQLVRAAVERKLRREPPFSQQDIVAEALTAWLKRHVGGN